MRSCICICTHLDVPVEHPAGVQEVEREDERGAVEGHLLLVWYWIYVKLVSSTRLLVS